MDYKKRREDCKNGNLTVLAPELFRSNSGMPLKEFVKICRFIKSCAIGDFLNGVIGIDQEAFNLF